MVGVRAPGLCFRCSDSRRCWLLEEGNSEQHSQEDWKFGITLLASFPGLFVFASRFWLTLLSFLPVCVFVHSPCERGSHLLLKLYSEDSFFPCLKSQWL